MSKTAIVYDPVFLKHETGLHPESPKRLEAIVSELKSSPFAGKLAWIKPVVATPSQLELIHTPEYVQLIEQKIREGAEYLDMDTIVCADSWEAALKAAGGVITAVRKVIGGEYKNAFCAVRPPGHHAEASRAMGFCLFNNVAIGARFAQRELAVSKVAIVDFDVHHGNGTQNAFYEDPTVFYVSLHQWPHYPGTGHKEERGAGEALGTNMNFELSSGDGDEKVLRIFDDEIIPTLTKFAPGLVMISAGFDAHRDDPLGGLSMTEAGFAGMTRRLLDMAEELGHGCVVATLEGGYNLQALGLSAAALVGEMAREV